MKQCLLNSKRNVHIEETLLHKEANAPESEANARKTRGEMKCVKCMMIFFSNYTKCAVFVGLTTPEPDPFLSKTSLIFIFRFQANLR